MVKSINKTRTSKETPNTHIERPQRLQQNLLKIPKDHEKPLKTPPKFQVLSEIQNCPRWLRSRCNLENEGGREAGGTLNAEFESLFAAAADAQFWVDPKFGAKADDPGLKLPRGGFGDVGEGVGGAIRSGCKYHEDERYYPTKTWCSWSLFYGTNLRGCFYIIPEMS